MPDREITFLVRASEGHRDEMLRATYTTEEFAFMRSLAQQAAKLEPGEERARILNEICVIHETKALLGATILPESEPSPESQVAAEGFEAAQRLRDEHGFNIPQGVMDAIASGQSSLLDEQIGPNAPRPEPQRFDPTPEGWVATHPAADVLAWAKRERARRDSQVGAGRYIANRESRWVGALAERGFAQWLEDQEVPFKWFGGVDGQPDFVVRDEKVGVKCQIVKVPFRGRYPVVVPGQQRERIQEPVLFFAAYEEPLNRLVLLGATTAAEFFERARFVKTGEPIGPRNVATNPVWQLSADALRPATEWLRR